MKQEQVWDFKKYKIDNNQRGGLTFIKIQRNRFLKKQNTKLINIFSIFRFKLV